jgi:N-acetylneuraminic acid mutarotase
MPPAGSAAAVTPFAFGASSYHLQIARDAAFSTIVVDTTLSTTSFTLGFDLDIATQYFWRVTASNACGASTFSTTGSFLVGACFEHWTSNVAVPIANGPAQASVIGSTFDNKLYVIGGGTGANPDLRIDELWAFDPLSQSWTQKASVPSPGVGSSFGAAAQVGGALYVFGGVVGPPGPITITSTAWKYSIASNTWTRIADLPTTNFGAAVAAIGGKIYIASGSGFLQQTWQYDPATNTYTRKADAPVVAQARMHATVINGEMHAFAGGFEGSAHLVYNPVTNSWRSAAPMPFTATDPAVGVVGGKVLVVGGRPIAHAQVYDQATDSWSQTSPIGLSTGVDNTSGAVLSGVFHLVGGFNGSISVNTHQQFHTCSLGTLSSAALVPFVVDGNGKKAGIGNEASALVIDNSFSGTPMSVSCLLYGTSGNLMGSQTISVAAGELKTVTDVVRQLTGTTTVQNAIGSLQLFGTEVFQGMASVVNNASGDPTVVDGQPITGSTNGWISTAGTTGYLTQTVFANASTTTSVLQVLAYPATGGSTPVAGTVAFIPAHGLVSYADVVKQLGLGATYSGQISWSASQPIAVMARDSSKSKPNFSGSNLVHGLADTGSTSFVSYVEDSTAFSTALELGNPGPTTANVTVRFVQTSDASGASSGTEFSRDIPVAVNSAAPIADIVRWTQFSTATTPAGQHGFLVVTTPQGVTAQGRLVDRSSTDPATVDGGALSGGFSPLLIRVDQLPFFQVNPAVASAQPTELAAAAAAATPTTASRVALANPGTAPITVNLTAFNATGSVAGTLSVTVAPDGQFFTENLGAAMGLPPVFFGWVQIQASGRVLVYNHRRTGTAGATIPVHAIVTADP